MNILKILCRVLLWIVGVLAVTLIGVYLFLQISTTPSHDRVWVEDQAVLPYADIDGDMVTIHNIRNFSYTSTTTYTPDYYDKTFDVSELKKVWYIVVPFEGIPGSAHTFLSFEFEGNEFITISVEARKELGEVYGPIKGLFNEFELMYVIADERDTIKLRSNYRKNQVYVYPAKTTPEKGRVLFLSMIERANTLNTHPEFYNTVFNSCTGNIVDHVNDITPNRVPFFNMSILFPANSDRLAYELGLIDTDLSFEEARARYLITERAVRHATSTDFSLKIREE